MRFYLKSLLPKMAATSDPSLAAKDLDEKNDTTPERQTDSEDTSSEEEIYVVGGPVRFGAGPGGPSTKYYALSDGRWMTKKRLEKMQSSQQKS